MRTLRHPDVGYVDDVMRDAVAWIAALPDIASSSDRALLDLVPTFPARIERLFVALLRASTMSGTGRGIAEELLKRGGDGDPARQPPHRQGWARSTRRCLRSGCGISAGWSPPTRGSRRPSTTAWREWASASRRLRSDAANAFEHEFDSFLADHGHRGPDEYEFASPTWATRPEIAFAAVDRLRHAPPERSPRIAQERLASERESALAEALRSVARPLRPVLRRGLAAAIVGAAARERAKDAFVRELSAMRAVLDELAARAQARGGPTDRRDCYLVTTGELDEFVRDPTGFADVIAERANAARLPAGARAAVLVRGPHPAPRFVGAARRPVASVRGSRARSTASACAGEWPAVRHG